MACLNAKKKLSEMNEKVKGKSPRKKKIRAPIDSQTRCPFRMCFNLSARAIVLHNQHDEFEFAVD